ncbi:MAG: cytochrome c [Prolixibacteraceae bacterium]
MQKGIAFTLSLSCTLLVMAGCGGHQREKPLPVDTSTFSEAEKSSKPVDRKQHPGEGVYKAYCATCHQPNGKGVPGMYPPLTPNTYIANKDSIIHVVLNGMQGKIEVDGEVFNNFMAPHSHLSDQELAEVISYVRSSFGNALDPVTADEVASARKK